MLSGETTYINLAVYGWTQQGIEPKIYQTLLVLMHFNRSGDVMVSVLASSAVDRGFESNQRR